MGLDNLITLVIFVTLWFLFVTRVLPKFSDG